MIKKLWIRFMLLIVKKENISIGEYFKTELSREQTRKLYKKNKGLSSLIKTSECIAEIRKIIKDKKLFKKNVNFLYMCLDFNIRKGYNTDVQLKALRRING